MAPLSWSGIISRLRNPKWGKVSVLISTLGLLFPIFSSKKEIISLIVLSGALLLLASITYANYFLTGIEATFLQVDSVSSAENHHNREYPIPNGYAEFDVYFNIPSWIGQFSINIEHDGPFNIGAWDLPNPVSFNEGVIHCDGNLEKVPFTLRFGGSPPEIGDASYKIAFRDMQTDRKVHSIVLDGDRRFETDLSISDIDSEVRDSLDLEIAE